MGNDWPYESVIDLQRRGALLVEDGNHGEYRPRREDFVAEGVCFIRAADMAVGRVLFESASRIHNEARRRIRKGIGQGGDILLSHKGTVGKVALVPIDAPRFVCSPQTTFWRVTDPSTIDRRYLYAYMRSHHFHVQLRSRQSETDMAPYVSLSAQRDLVVPLPPIETQRKIGSILSTLDDKIELNQRMDRTLKKMAEAIFKSWFIDFDPVHAKVEGRAAYLPAEIADLFPDSFEDSALGLIPKGWDVKSLDDIANYMNGLACQKYPSVDGQKHLPVVKIRELRQGITDHTERASADVPPKYIVKDGDVLFSWSGSLLVRLWCGGSAVLNQHVFKITSTRVPKWFFYQATYSYLDDFRDIASDKATTMGHIKRHHLTDAKMAIPDRKLMEKGTEVLGAIFDRRINTLKQVQALSILRDSLLPNLIDGKPNTSTLQSEIR